MNFKEVAELFSEIANNYPKLDGALYYHASKRTR